MFKVGDEVTIDTDRVPNTNIRIAPGTAGRVVSIREDSSWSLNKLWYAVSYPDDTYWFEEEHLSPMDGYILPEPLFDLDDMELAEILMEELREKLT